MQSRSTQPPDPPKNEDQNLHIYSGYSREPLAVTHQFVDGRSWLFQLIFQWFPNHTLPPPQTFCNKKMHCCQRMKTAAESECAQHKDRWDCPDALISYSAKFDEYGIIIHDGGSSKIAIQFCPWCGAKLPGSQSDRWFDELEALGFSDPFEDDIPERYNDHRWREKEAEGGDGDAKEAV